LPAVFAGAPLVVRARWHGQPRPGASVVLRGRLPAGTEFVERIALDSARPDAALAQSWARAHIRDLEDQYAAGGHRAGLEQAIVAVSLRHRVLCRFTAFVAVDRVVVNPGGNPQVVTQPVERPAGWGADPAAAAPGDSFGAAHFGGTSGAPPAMPAGPTIRPGRGAAAEGAAVNRTGSKSVMSMPARPRPAAADESVRSAPARPVGPPSPAAAPPAPAARSAAPAAPMPVPPGQPRARVATLPPGPAKAEEAARHGGTPPIDAAPYVQRLHAIADDLAKAASAKAPANAAQLPVARLGELLEDLRTVGLDALATKLAPLVDRLRAALTGSDLVAVLHEVAAKLRKLPDGDDEPPPPRRRGWAFWR
jgi:Ca-activated chloride channel family protein